MVAYVSFMTHGSHPHMGLPRFCGPDSSLSFGLYTTVLGRASHRAAMKVDWFLTAAPNETMDTEKTVTPAATVKPMAERVAMAVLWVAAL
jgi:hypothetical protein